MKVNRSESEFIKQFSDYDQTVDVVSCWHSLSQTIYNFDGFHRFPKLSPGDLTPDFALTVEKQDRDGVIHAINGSLICDIKRFPHPFSDPSLDKPDYRGYKKSIEQLERYAGDLTLLQESGGKIRYSEHDVVLLTKTDVVDVVYKYLSESQIPKPFNIGRPLVVVEYSYDGADQQERYVFKWKQGELNSQFTNPILRKHMIDRAQPMKVPPSKFIPNKLQYVICNDSPPTIYMLVFLWLEILPDLVQPEQYAADARSTRTC